jgi:hypothetical protein
MSLNEVFVILRNAHATHDVVLAVGVRLWIQMLWNNAGKAPIYTKVTARFLLCVMTQAWNVQFACVITVP